MSRLDPRERVLRRRLRDDFAHFAQTCLSIRTKEGATAPLVLNRIQAHVHERLERQLAQTGRVRALVLKGRQGGVSTYVAARFYHRATHRRGVQVFILTHEDEATANLFGMVERFHAHSPHLVKPSTGTANSRALSFDRLDSGYAVGTARTRGVGRSRTVQMLHGSEVAFWPNAASHFAGVIQAIPDLPGTEVILESTANGIGGAFHTRWRQAEAGVGDYVAIFVPWFWSAEYRKPAPAGFSLDGEEETYAAAHGLSAEQMAWRRAKLAELGDPMLFAQEYPATAAEAFQVTGHDGFIAPALVLAARKAVCEAVGPLILGADPAHTGADLFALAWRRGRKVLKVERRAKLDVVAGANWVRQVIDTDKPDRVFLDVGGVGAGVHDLLKSWGGAYERATTPVNFGGEPQSPEVILPDGGKRPGPKNRRAEMWMRSRDWLAQEGGADIPDDDALHADACAPGYSYDANQRLLLESKQQMRARGLGSPDGWDAVALTFAAPVKYREPAAPLRREAYGRRRTGANYVV